MNDKFFFILSVSVIFAVFLINNFEITGEQVMERFCEDSDNGIFIYTAGYVDSDIGVFYDRCFDNLRQIREYFCVEGRRGGRYQVESRVVSCGIGYECERDVNGLADMCVRS